MGTKLQAGCHDKVPQQIEGDLTGNVSTPTDPLEQQYDTYSCRNIGIEYNNKTISSSLSGVSVNRYPSQVTTTQVIQTKGPWQN